MIIIIENTNARIVEKKICRYRRKRRDRVIRRRLALKRNSSFIYLDRLKIVSSLLLKEMEKRGYISAQYKTKQLEVPECFSLKTDFDDSIIFFKRLLSTFFYKEGDVKVDFSKCKEMSNANYVLFDLFVKELLAVQARYNKNIYLKSRKQVIISSPSKVDDKTNKYLITGGYVDLDDVDNVNANESFLPLQLFKGKNKNYQESLKGIAAKYVSRFVRTSLDRVDYQEFANDKNAIEGFITEILSNAEEHSISNSEWYISGISFHEDQHNVNIVELNLSVINVGVTMYEGFEATKELNHANYSLVEKLYGIHRKQFTLFKRFERESLFMLYMLNDDISRLKYEGEGRGNGTMHFINKFIYLGRYGIENADFNPVLNVISGHTVLTCDGKYQPSDEVTNKMILSLNKDKTLAKLPDSDYLCAHKEFFPGTILECKIYLNKDYFKAKEIDS